VAGANGRAAARSSAGFEEIPAARKVAPHGHGSRVRWEDAGSGAGKQGGRRGDSRAAAAGVIGKGDEPTAAVRTSKARDRPGHRTLRLRRLQGSNEKRRDRARGGRARLGRRRDQEQVVGSREGTRTTDIPRYPGLHAAFEDGVATRRGTRAVSWRADRDLRRGREDRCGWRRARVDGQGKRLRREAAPSVGGTCPSRRPEHGASRSVSSIARGAPAGVRRRAGGRPRQLFWRGAARGRNALGGRGSRSSPSRVHPCWAGPR